MHFSKLAIAVVFPIVSWAAPPWRHRPCVPAAGEVAINQASACKRRIELPESPEHAVSLEVRDDAVKDWEDAQLGVLPSGLDKRQDWKSVSGVSHNFFRDDWQV